MTQFKWSSQYLSVRENNYISILLLITYQLNNNRNRLDCRVQCTIKRPGNRTWCVNQSKLFANMSWNKSSTYGYCFVVFLLLWEWVLEHNYVFVLSVFFTGLYQQYSVWSVELHSIFLYPWVSLESAKYYIKTVVHTENQCPKPLINFKHIFIFNFSDSSKEWDRVNRGVHTRMYTL